MYKTHSAFSILWKKIMQSKTWFRFRFHVMFSAHITGNQEGKKELPEGTVHRVSMLKVGVTKSLPNPINVNKA